MNKINHLKKILSCSLSSLIFSTCFSGYKSSADFNFNLDSKLNTNVNAFSQEQNNLLNDIPDAKQTAFAQVQRIIKNDINYLGYALVESAFDYDFSDFDTKYAPNILFQKLLTFHRVCMDKYSAMAVPEDQSNEHQWNDLIDNFKARLEELKNILTNNNGNTLNGENFKGVTDVLLADSNDKNYTNTLQGYINYYLPWIGGFSDKMFKYTECTNGANAFRSWTQAFLQQFSNDLGAVIEKIETVKSKNLGDATGGDNPTVNPPDPIVPLGPGEQPPVGGDPNRDPQRQPIPNPKLSRSFLKPVVGVTLLVGGIYATYLVLNRSKNSGEIRYDDDDWWYEDTDWSFED